MMRLARVTIGLFLSLALWCVLGVWASSVQDDPSGFVGLRATPKSYHRPTCALVKRANVKSKVALADLVEAETEGYRPCTVCRPNVDLAAQPAPGKKGAAGGKAVSTAPGIVFSRDIAPVLVANCSGCHEGPQAKKQFDLSTFNKLMKGSPAGKMIEARDPVNSELVLRIKGESQGRKMPPGNNTALAPETIAKIETWVRGGALLDGGLDPNANLKTYAPSPEELRKAEVARMAPEQRDQLAETRGRERIKKATEAGAFEKVSSPHFVLLSNLPKERGEALLKGLETRVTRVKALLGPSSTKLLEGPVKIGVYVFNEVNPYAEFVRGNENRELEAGTVAHARLDVEAPYIVAIDPLGGREDPGLNKKAASPPKTKVKKAEMPTGPDRSLEGTIVEKLADDATRKVGKVPGWLSLGVGAFFAAQVDPRSRYVVGIRAHAYQQLQLNWVAKVNDTLRGEADLESQRAIGLSLVEWLANTQAAQLTGFIRTLETPEQGERIEDVIKKGWGVDADKFYQEWGLWVRAAYARARG